MKILFYKKKIMKKEFMMKLTHSNYVIIWIVAFFSISFIPWIYPFLSLFYFIFFYKSPEYFNYFIIVLVILFALYWFIVYFLIKNKLIPFLNKENKIILYDNKMEFLEDKKVETPNWTRFFSEKKYIKYEQINKIEENYDDKNITLFLSEDEKYFYAKDFQNENDYFEFINILKRKTK